MSNNISKNEDGPLSLDAVAEDLFGLNIRGLRSVTALWLHPAQYFSAARTPDWGSIYTPSIRLWLSFFALFSALKFWWLGSNEGMISAFADGFEQAGLMLPDDVTYRDIGKEAVLWIFGLIPILQIGTMVILSVIFPFWGERTTLALRQRYFFSAIVPSTSLMPIFMTLMMLVPSGSLSVYGVGLAVVSFAIDFQTCLRGAYPGLSTGGRIWRAGLLSLIVVVLNVILSVGAQIAGIILTSQRYGVAPVG